jgi:lysophospholipase L1-like esterase
MQIFAGNAWVAATVAVVLLGCGSAQDGTGGTTSTGGKGSGGMTASGGSPSNGGAQTGGSGGKGGVPSSGGNNGTGGSSATGGSNTAGGLGSGGATGGPRTGGSVSSGGAIGGSNPTGGSNATGGNTSGGTTGTGGGTTLDGGPGHTGKWQMMTLGDSITETTCYPQLLSQALTKNGRTNFTFIGTRQANQGCGGLAPVPTEGHGGYLVTYLTSDSHKSENKGSMTELLAWAAEKPEVVLMEYGTNDCWTSSIPISDITSAYGFVLDKFRAQNPKVIFFVAKITPLNPAGCSTCESRVESLNALIPAWAASKTTADSPVYGVDVFSALDPKTYVPNSTWTQDGCHPLQPAAQLMADKWYAALVEQGLP